MDHLEMTRSPEENRELGQTAGRLLALEGNAGFVGHLAALLHAAHHALVDAGALVG